VTTEADYQRELRERDARQKRFDAVVVAATDAVASAIVGSKPALHSRFFYGATGIHPRHLVTWYLFATDVELEEAKRVGLTGRIDALTREHLARQGYPAEAIPEVMVSFTTDEDIQHQTGGDYWAYFK
jgi:hypothetical protein